MSAVDNSGASPAMNKSADQVGKTGLLVRMNELQSENFSLRSRLQSTVEELRIAQRAAQKKSSTPAPARGARASSVEVSCTVDREAQTTGATICDYQQKVSRLQQELHVRNDKISALEAAHANHVSQALTSTPPRNKSDDVELVRAKEHIATLEATLRRTKALQSLDDGSADVVRELRNELAHVLESNNVLQSRVDALQRENRQQRIALGLDGGSGTPQQPEEEVSREAPQRQRDDSLTRVQTLFRLYGKTWSVDEVERLLHQDETIEVDKRLRDQHASSSGPLLHIEHTLAANQQLRDELSMARDELLSAHQKIEELTVTVQLHGRYQDLHVSKSAEMAASEGAQQAASEIAFLCDTLAAMKMETEFLGRKLTRASSERDAAVAAFEELRVRSEQMLHGCEEIATSSQQDAQTTIQAAHIQLRSRERELSLLRGELLGVSRQLEEQRQLKTSLENDLVECRTKLLSVKDTCSTVRTEAKQAKLDKQAALAQVSSIQKQLSACQDKARILEGQLAVAHRSNAEISQRNARRRSGRSVSPSATSVSNTEDPREDVGSQDTEQHPSLVVKQRTATPSSKRFSTNGGDSDELKQCFLELQGLVPGALTARDVTKALRANLEKATEHRSLLETELRKKSSALAKAKKTETELLEKIEALQKKVSHVAALEKKLDGKDKLIDKTKRELQAIKDEDTKTQRKNKDDVLRMTSEKEKLEQELALVRRELDEGKEVMLQLLRESID